MSSNPFRDMIKQAGLDPDVFDVAHKIPPASKYYDMHIIKREPEPETVTDCPSIEDKPANIT